MHPCSDPDALAGLLEGEPDPALLGHLSECAACRGRLERLAVGTAGWLLTAPESAERPEALKLVIESLEADVPVGPFGGEPLACLRPCEYPGSIGAIGPYAVLNVVGQGGMGVVLRAFDADLHRVVAVKVLAPGLAAVGTARQRFAREARAAAAVAHEHVVAIHAVAEDAGTPYLVMEYVPGGSLQDRLDRDGPLSPREALRVGIQVASGLAAAHAQGLVHRDVKPANVLLENGDGRARLTDFGLARAADDAGVTRTGVVVGTPEYMAPEQAAALSHAPAPIDARADLFALGGTLYAAATGRPPFRAHSTLGVLHLVTSAAPANPRSLNAEIPPEFEGLIMRLLEKDPARRPQSAADVADDMRRLLVRLESPRPPQRPRRALAYTVAAAALMGLVALAGAVVVMRFPAPEGTLVVEVDDPEGTVKVERDGETVRVTGAGVSELRLAPGSYKVRSGDASEVVQIERGSKTVFKARFEPKAIAAVPPAHPRPADPLLPARLPLGIAPAPATVPIVPVNTPEMSRRAVYAGHEGTVRAIAVTPDGKTMITASGWPAPDGTVRVWNLETGKLAVTREVGKVRADALAISPDGALVAVGLEDGSVLTTTVARLAGAYAAADSKHEPVEGFDRKWKALPAEVCALAFSPNGGHLAVGGNGGKVLVYKRDQTEAEREVEAHDGTIRALAWSPDGTFLVSGGTDGKVCVWGTKEFKSLHVYEAAGQGPVWAVGVSKSGRVAAAGRRLIIYDPKTPAGVEREYPNFTLHADAITALAFAPDGQRVATVSFDESLAVWDLRVQGSAPVAQARPRPGCLFAVAWTPDGKDVLTGGGAVFLGPDFTPTGSGRYEVSRWAAPAARAWKPTPPPGVGRPGAGGPGGMVPGAPPPFAPAGRGGSGAGGSGAVPAGPGSPVQTPPKVAAPVTPSLWPVRSFDGLKGDVRGVAVAGDGKLVVAAGAADGGRSLRVWDAATGAERANRRLGDNAAEGLAVDPAGERVAVALSGGEVLVAKLQMLVDTKGAGRGASDAGEALATIRVPSGSRAVAFSPDGETLAVAGDKGAVLLPVADPTEGGRPLSPLFKDYVAVSFTPDGESLVTVQGDGRTFVWDAKTVETRAGRGFIVTNPLRSLAVFAELIAVGTPKGIFVYDSSNSKEIVLPANPTSVGGSTAFDREGKRLAAVLGDGSVLVWALSPPRLLASAPPGTAAPSAGVVWTPDGKGLVTASPGGVLTLWSLPAASAVPPADTRSAAPERGYGGRPERTYRIAVTADGRFLLTVGAGPAVGDGGEVRVWDVASGDLFAVRRFGEPGTDALAVALVGNRVAFACADGGLRTASVSDIVAKADTSGLVFPFRAARVRADELRAVALSPDGGRVAVGTARGELVVYRWNAEVAEWSFKAHAGTLRSAAFADGGKRLLTAGDEGKVYSWDATTPGPGEEVFAGGRDHSVAAVAVSGDGLAIAGDRLDVRRGRTGTPWEHRHTGGLTAVAFSPDGKRVATGGADGTVCVWTGGERADIARLPAGTVLDLAWTPDGRSLMAVDGPGQVTRWAAP